MKTIKYKISGYGSMVLEYDTYQEMVEGLKDVTVRYPDCTPSITLVETKHYELTLPDLKV